MKKVCVSESVDSNNRGRPLGICLNNHEKLLEVTELLYLVLFNRSDAGGRFSKVFITCQHVPCPSSVCFLMSKL